jgi:hypothetical protein
MAGSGRIGKKVVENGILWFSTEDRILSSHMQFMIDYPLSKQVALRPSGLITYFVKDSDQCQYQDQYQYQRRRQNNTGPRLLCHEWAEKKEKSLKGNLKGLWGPRENLGIGTRTFAKSSHRADMILRVKSR